MRFILRIERTSRICAAPNAARRSAAVPARVVLIFMVAIAVWGMRASVSHAGAPECGGFRIEDAKSCTIEGDLDCDLGCEQLGIYKKACATKLHKVCRTECTLDPEPTCTDSCTESCKSQCDRGISITCAHNCFGECRTACGTQCAEAADRDQCMASCEATCDGECDVKCGAVVDGDCYYHCIECCGGSCTAQANMNCQETCQDEMFEDCEYELRADCDASCSGSGAIFCDGEFVLAGSDIPDCAKALAAEGFEVEVNAKDVVDELRSRAGSGSGLCSFGPPGASDHGGAVPAFGLLVGLLWARRKG